MEQSIKRDEDLVGYTIKGVLREHGSLYFRLNDGMHAVLSAANSIEHDCEVVFVEPDITTLARRGFITVEQLEYELREEIAGRNWIRVKELADALKVAEAYNRLNGLCELCGTPIINDCPRCGAPQCCPKCCTELEVEHEGTVTGTTREDDQCC